MTPEEARKDFRVAPLTEENLREAPEWGAHPWSCKYCLYWEHPELLADPRAENLAEAFQRKLAWVRRVRREFGDCGRLLYGCGQAVGYAQYAPPGFLPNVRTYPAGPASADAVFLACLFFPSRAHQRRGWGSLLLQDILRELDSRGVRAVETVARTGNAENPSGPVEFYLRHGFTVQRDDPEFPLLRLNLAH